MQLPPGHSRVSAVATLEALVVDLPEGILWGDRDDRFSRAIVKTIDGELHLFSVWYNRDNPEQVGRVSVQLLVRDPEAQLVWIEVHHEDVDDDCALEDVFARCRYLQHHWPNLPASQPGKQPEVRCPGCHTQIDITEQGYVFDAGPPYGIVPRGEGA